MFILLKNLFHVSNLFIEINITQKTHINNKSRKQFYFKRLEISITHFITIKNIFNVKNSISIKNNIATFFLPTRIDKW